MNFAQAVVRAGGTTTTFARDTQVAAQVLQRAGASLSGFGLGVLVTGVSLTSIGAGPRGTTTSVTAHQAYDQGLSLGGAGAALVLAIAGQGAVAVSILVIAAALFTLSMATRYSAR